MCISEKYVGAHGSSILYMLRQQCSMSLGTPNISCCCCVLYVYIVSEFHIQTDLTKSCNLILISENIKIKCRQIYFLRNDLLLSI